MEELELEQVSNRTLEQIDLLLQRGHLLTFSSGDVSLWYEIAWTEKDDVHFPYSISIGTEHEVIYVERYVHLGTLIEQEPFDLSKFRIREQ